MPDHGNRSCGWCDGPIPSSARVDSRYCGTPCRQAAHRAKRGLVVREATSRPLRLAYADPPYPKKARRYYAAHPDYAGEVDHAALIARLGVEFPDGWALSTNVESLQDVLALCPPGVRVAAWVRGERPVAAWGPLNAWEPVIVAGGRPVYRPAGERIVDVFHRTPRARATDPRRVVGSKPYDFAYWVFELLGARPGDDLVDLYPGAEAIGRAWAWFTAAGRQPDVDGPELVEATG